MRAVFRHELSSHFTSVSANVFGAFFLLFAGIYTMIYNLKGATTTFEYVPANMSFVFIVIIPILTMRVLADERRQKTDQLLYSLPLSMTQVVLGKFFAMMVVLLVPTLIISIYPLVLCAFGRMNLPHVGSVLLSFYLMGCALIAIGTYISSLTESPVAAAGLCFAVMLVNYFLASLASYISNSAMSSLVALLVVVILAALLVFRMTHSDLASALTMLVPAAVLGFIYWKNSAFYEGLVPELVKKLSLFERFYTFVDGMLDLTGLVYFASIAGLFLFLSIQTMEKRRWAE